MTSKSDALPASPNRDSLPLLSFSRTLKGVKIPVQPDPRALKKEARRRRRVGTPPPVSALVPTRKLGQEHPLSLNSGKPLIDETSLTEEFRVPAVTVEQVKVALKSTVERFGFAVTFESSYLSKASQRKGGPSVRGYLFAERGLLADRQRTRRRNRVRTAIILGLSPASGWGWYAVSIAAAHTWLIRFGTIAAIGASLPMMLSAWGFMTGDYWSDVIAFDYRAPVPVADKSGDPMHRLLDWKISATVGRALSQDWVGKGLSGRAAVVLFPEPDLDPIREGVRESLTGQE